MKDNPVIQDHEMVELYAQCAVASQQLFDHFECQESILGSAMEQLDIGEQLMFTSKEEVFELAKHALAKIGTLSGQLEPFGCIAILMDAISRYYVEAEVHQATALGAGMKLALDHIWPNIFTASNTPSGYRADGLIAVIELGIFFCQLETLRAIWSVQEFDEILLTKDGITEPLLYSNISREMQAQGRHEYKVIPDVTKHIWNDLANFIPALERILIYPSTNVELLFPNSFLGKIPAKSTTFWKKLWAHLILVSITVGKKNQLLGSESASAGIIFFQELLIAIRGLPASQNPQSFIEDIFWQRDWHRKQITNADYFTLQHMIVERPALRIGYRPTLFATSLLCCLDTINTLLEDYVHSSQGNTIYERYFSGPFENEIIELFRSHDWRAGEVTHSGFWKTQTAAHLLSSKRPIPGQVDILTIAPDEKTAVIGECKLLKFPYDTKTLRNLINKIGDDDGEGYHSKLRKKKEWLSTTHHFTADNIEVYCVLITNRFVPFALNSTNLIISKRHLALCLEQQLPVKAWKAFIRNLIYHE